MHADDSSLDLSREHWNLMPEALFKYWLSFIGWDKQEKD